MTPDWTQNTRALKLLVIVMTTLLIVGLIVLVVGMVRTAGKIGAELGEIEVPVPAGATLIEVDADGGKLFLGLRHADGGQEIVVLEASTGRRLGSYRLTDAP